MRDTVIIGVACIVAIVLGAWLYLTGENRPLAPAAPTGPVTWELLAEGNDSGSITTRTNYRIKSREELDELVRMLYGPDSPALRSVDFEREEVLAIFDGTHSSGGYAIRIESIMDDGLLRTVALVHEEPGESCRTSSAITSPFLLVTVPKTSASLARDEQVEVTECN